MPASWTWSGLLRWGGVIVLAAGLLVGWRSFPTRPSQDWSTIHTFELDTTECAALREERGTAHWLAPRSLAAPVGVPEVARKFRLELALVCQANELPGAACSSKTLTPGEGRLLLPLYREPPPLPARRTP